MQGCLPIGNGVLYCNDNDLKLTGSVENVIVMGDRCQIIDGPHSIVLRVDFLHLNAQVGSIEISNPDIRNCASVDGGLVITVNPLAHERGVDKSRVPLEWLQIQDEKKEEGGPSSFAQYRNVVPELVFSSDSDASEGTSGRPIIVDDDDGNESDESDESDDDVNVVPP